MIQQYFVAESKFKHGDPRTIAKNDEFLRGIRFTHIKPRLAINYYIYIGLSGVYGGQYGSILLEYN